MVAKKNHLYFHVLVTIVLMFGFNHLPTPDPITPTGMKLLGIFFGLVYAWTFSTLIWPSILGVIALTSQGVVTMAEFLPLGFANETFVFLLIACIFAAALEKTGVSQYLANWCLSRKIFNLNPWLMLFALMLTSVLVASFANILATMLIMWSIFYKICEKVSIKPFEKVATLSIFGIAIASTMGMATLPFRTGPVIILGLYNELTGITVNYLHFFFYIIPMILIILITYLLICKFVFRMDVSKLKAFDMKTLSTENLSMDKKTKIVFLYLICFIVLTILPSILPQDLFLTQILKNVGNIGLLFTVLLAMMLTKIDDEPLINFSELAKTGIIWDMVMLLMAAMPISSLMMQDETGIKQFLLNYLQPFFSNVSPLVFMIVILVMTTVITNFANNTVIAIIFVNITCSLAASLEVNATPIICTLMLCDFLAFLTPAASAQGAMVFGNTKWMRAKDIYRYASVSMLILMVVTIACGLTLGNLIF